MIDRKKMIDILSEKLVAATFTLKESEKGSDAYIRADERAATLSSILDLLDDEALIIHEKPPEMNEGIQTVKEIATEAAKAAVAIYVSMRKQEQQISKLVDAGEFDEAAKRILISLD